MLAVKFDSKKVVVEEVPPPAGSDVLVRVRACGICGSDLTLLDREFPIQGIPGHEIAGELMDGTPVAIEPIDPCGDCRYCQRGDYQVCPSSAERIYGVSLDGGMAEQIRVPARCLVPLPRGLDPRTAFLVEPLAVAIHGVRRARVEKSMRVLVVGAGTIGLCAVVAASAVGAEVALLARHPGQVEAGAKLGVEIVSSESLDDYDVVLDCAGTPSATAISCQALRPNGTLLLFAPSWETIALPGFTAIAKELQFVVAKMYGRTGTLRDADSAAAILGARDEIADALISHRYALADAPRAFETARDRKSGAIKVVLEP